MKNFLKNAVLIALLLGSIAGAYSQSTHDYLKKITPELLKQDFRVLRDSLQNLHAGLYRYKTADEMNSMFDHCYQQIDRPMTETSYFVMISSLISNIEDGHTECFL